MFFHLANPSRFLSTGPQVSTLTCPGSHCGWASTPQSCFQAQSGSEDTGWPWLAGSVPTATSICQPDGELAQTWAVPQQAVLNPREVSGHASFLSRDMYPWSACPWVHLAPAQAVSAHRLCAAAPRSKRCKLFFRTKLDWTCSPKGVGGKAASYPRYCFHSSTAPETGVVFDIIRALLLCLQSLWYSPCEETLIAVIFYC